MRGLASIYIFISHLISVFLLPITGIWTTTHYFTFISASYLLMSFFVISGFVITISIFNNKKRNGYFCWKHYLKNRILRFYPPLILALLLSLLITPLAFLIWPNDNLSLLYPGETYAARDFISVNFETYLKNLLLLHQVISDWPTINNNGPLWTIGIEFWIYISAMLVALISFKYGRCYGLIPLTLIVIYIIYDMNYNLMQLSTLWGIGSLIAILNINKLKFDKRLTISIFFSLLTISAYFLYNDIRVGIPYTDIKARLFQILVMTALTILFCLYHQRFKCSQSIVRLGRISLSIYIFHFPLLLFFYYLLHPVYFSAPLLIKLLLASLAGIITFYICKLFASWVDLDSKLYQSLKSK